MDRKLARRNIYTGLVAAARDGDGVRPHLPGRVGLPELMADAQRRRRATARARRSTSPAPALLPMFTALGITLALLGLILSGLFIAAGGC